MFTSLHQRLLDALHAQDLLPRLVRALNLPTSTPNANLDLLIALLHHPPLADPMHALAQGDSKPLTEALERRYPHHLPERILHHLALTALHSDNPQERTRGLHGMLFLIQQRRAYLEAIAEQIEAAQHLSVLDALPQRLLAQEIQQLQGLGASALTDHRNALEARDTLRTLLEQLTPVAHDTLLAPLREHLEQATKRAIQRIIERCEDHLHALQGDHVESSDALPDFDTAFEPAARLAGDLGHQEDLSAWVVSRAVETGWDLRHMKRMDALGALVRATLDFAVDLGERLERDEAFGHQSVYADFCVHRYHVAPQSEHQTLLRRALQICPQHRNAKVCLAGVNLREAQNALLAIQSSWTTLLLKDRAREQFARAYDLIEEAQELRPEHKSLPSVIALRDEVQQRLQG